MMSDVPLEKCWAFNKRWNNKFYYKVRLVGCFYWFNFIFLFVILCTAWDDRSGLKLVDSSWNVMAHGYARRGNWRMEWVASTLHTTSEHGVSSIATADAHTSAASSRLNWLPRQFKWTRPFRRKTKNGFCACAITFQLASTCGLLVRVQYSCVWRWFINEPNNMSTQLVAFR